MMQSLLSIGLSNAFMATVLAGVALLASRIFRKPALTHALWLLVIVKLLCPSFISLPLPSFCLVSAPESPASFVATMQERNVQSTVSSVRPQKPIFGSTARHAQLSERIESIASESAGQASPVSFSREHWMMSTGVIWLVGMGFLLSVAFFRLQSYRRIVARTECAATAIQLTTGRIAEKLGVCRVPSVRIVDAAVAPHAWAMWGRPIIVLPRRLVADLDGKQLEMVLAHELVHLKRGDHWLRWVELTAVVLYWWQPVVWFARRQLSRAAEQCCDARVVREFPGHARSYAAALLKTVEFLDEQRPVLPVGGTGFSEGRFFQGRFEMILKHHVRDQLTSRSRVLIAGAALVVLPISMSAVRADKPAATESSKQDAKEAPLPTSSVSENAPTLEHRIERIEALLNKLPQLSAGEADAQKKLPVQSPMTASEESAKSTSQDNVQKLPEFEDALKMLGKPLHDIGDLYQMAQTNFNRQVAAQKQREAVEAAFFADTVSFDLLLDAQRREFDANCAYAENLLEVSRVMRGRDPEQLHAIVKLQSAKQGRKRALELWQKVHEAYVRGSSHSADAKRDDEKLLANEAAAREQYFFFRDQVNDALNDYYRAKKNDKAEP
jgi:beta-lactamase regulating signal transducer with metallopeptidase domain